MEKKVKLSFLEGAGVDLEIIEVFGLFLKVCEGMLIKNQLFGLWHLSYNFSLTTVWESCPWQFHLILKKFPPKIEPGYMLSKPHSPPGLCSDSFLCY